MKQKFTFNTCFTVLFIAGFLSTQLSAQNQVWPKPGATWIYQNDLFLKLLLKFKYTKDTIIDGVNCQQISLERKQQYEPYDPVTYNKSYIYSKSVGDSVYLSFDLTKGFDFMFDFSVTKNTTWKRENTEFTSCSDTSVTTIDSVSSKTINGKNLQVLYVHSEENASSKQGGTIYERLGHYNNGICQMFYPYNGNCGGVTDWYAFVLLSYEDKDWNFHPNGVNGEETFRTLGIENTFSTSMNIYPNPASEQLFIQGMDEITEFTLFNSIGVEVKLEAYKRNNGTVEFNVAAYPKGLYYIQNKNTGEVVQWIKN